MGRALTLALLGIAVGCIYLFVAQPSAVHPMWFPAGASAQSATVDREFRIALWVLGGLFVAGQLLLAIFLARSRGSRASANSAGNWKLEVTWTVAMAAIFLWFHISGGRIWSQMMHYHPSPNAVRVEVTGAQFQWYFRYAGADGTLGRVDAQKYARPDEGNPLGIDPSDPAGRDDIVSTAMVVPVGRDVELTLRAQDVIHSLFIPAMRFKQDAVPGIEIHQQFTPTQVGNYEIACAELCGTGHYRMRATVRVVSEEEFEKWLKEHQKSSDE